MPQESGESDSAMHDSDPASSSSRPNSAQPSPVGPASPSLPGTPLIFKSPSSLGMPLQPSNPAAGLLHASLQQPPAPTGPPHLKGIPEGQPGVPSTDALGDQTAGPAQVKLLRHALRLGLARHHISLCCDDTLAVCVLGRNLTTC